MIYSKHDSSSNSIIETNRSGATLASTLVASTLECLKRRSRFLHRCLDTFSDDTVHRGATFAPEGGATIIELDGRVRTVAEHELAEFSAMPASLMPEGLEAALSNEEFRDLIAFLESCR